MHHDESMAMMVDATFTPLENKVLFETSANAWRNY